MPTSPVAAASLATSEPVAASVAASEHTQPDVIDSFAKLLSNLETKESDFSGEEDGFVERLLKLADTVQPDWTTEEPCDAEPIQKPEMQQPESSAKKPAGDARKDELNKQLKLVSQTGVFDMHGSTVGYAWARDLKKD